MQSPRSSGVATIPGRQKNTIMTFEDGFLEDSIKRFLSYKELGDKTFAQLEEKHFFFQPSTESNSIAVVVKHMHGNMLSRWTNFLTEDGEKDWRQRDAEFEESISTSISSNYGKKAGPVCSTRSKASSRWILTNPLPSAQSP
jgi:hypothetical protein